MDAYLGSARGNATQAALTAAMACADDELRGHQ